MFDYYEYFKNKGNHPDPKEILALEKELSFHQLNEQIINDMLKDAVEYAKKYEKDVSVRIIYNGNSYSIMNNNGEDWLSRKEKVVNETHHSSYYIFLNNITSHNYDYMIHDEKYGICGGGFPLILDHKIAGTFTCTGLRPQEDHDVIISTIRKYLKSK